MHNTFLEVLKMSDYEMIENIIYNKEHIVNWSYKELPKIKHYELRIYYKPDKDKELKYGFFFYCVEAVAWEADSEKPIGWKCIFHGIARFDGIRHFYLGDIQTFNDCYLYYPDLDIMISFLQELKKLEKEFCDENSLGD